MTKILPFIVLCFAVVVSSSPLVDAGGNYYVSHWNEEIVVNEDASLTISENVTFRFLAGDFGYAYRSIPHRGFDDMISVSVTDYEGNSLEYSLKKGNDYEVRWEWERIYVGSEPIEKTFVLTYTLVNAMNYENADPYRDRLYWNIVTDYARAIYNMSIDVILPDVYILNSINATSYSSFYARARSPPEIVSSTTCTIVRYHQPIVGSGEAFTVDIYFPATVKRPPPPPPPLIRSYLDLVAPWYSFAMILLGIIAIVKIRSFKKRFRDPETPTISNHGDQPPKDVRPPEAGVLTDMKIARKHLASALLDLAQRGYLDINVEPKERYTDLSFRKSLEVESFTVTLTEKGIGALQSKDPDLRRYESYLMKSIDARPITKTDLSMITAAELREKFGLEAIKDELVEKGLVDPEAFEKKGTNLMILGVVLALLGFAVIILCAFVGSANWWMNMTTFLPAIVFALARTTGPRTAQGATVCRQTRNFLERKMRELKEKAKLSPIVTIQHINDLAPWLVLHRTFHRLLRAPDKAMKNLEATGKQNIRVLPSYIKTSGRSLLTIPPYHFYLLWCSFYAIPIYYGATGGGGFGGGFGGGGGAGGGGGGGGGGAG